MTNIDSDNGCWYKAVTVDGTMYEVSGVMSGGLGELLGKSVQWTASSERSQARTSRKRAIQDELKDLYRVQARRRQPSSQIAVEIDAQKKLLQVAEEQKNVLVRLLEELDNLFSVPSDLENQGRSRNWGGCWWSETVMSIIGVEWLYSVSQKVLSPEVFWNFFPMAENFKGKFTWLLCVHICTKLQNVIQLSGHDIAFLCWKCR